MILAWVRLGGARAARRLAVGGSEGAGQAGARGASSAAGSGEGGFAGASLAALGLGAAGALPFLGLTPQGADALAALAPPGAPGGDLLAWARERRVALQTAYGASILSFLGAVHWGLALSGRGAGALSYAWSVVPSLVAWPCAALPACVGLQVSAGGLLVAGAVDVALLRRGLLPGWYVTGLRVPLTVIAVGSLGVSLASEVQEAEARRAERGAGGASGGGTRKELGASPLCGRPRGDPCRRGGVPEGGRGGLPESSAGEGQRSNSLLPMTKLPYCL